MKHVKTYMLLQLFKNFKMEDIQTLENQTNVIKLKRGQPLFLAGDSSGFLYGVVVGSLKIVRETQSGKAFITRIVGPGKLVGLRELFSDFKYIRSCSALEDTEILAIHRNAIMGLMKRNTDINLHFLKLFSLELMRMETMLESYLNRSAKTRLATILYDFFEMFSTDNETFVSPLKRRDIAELAGMTPETVSRALNDLKKAKIIETRGNQFFVLDPVALKNYDE